MEAYDGGAVRIEKIAALIRNCRRGIHDISRTEPNPAGLPRFNMPFELGLFLGARRFGAGRRRNKTCLVMDRDPYRYQSYLSDIAGQDIQAHSGDPARAIGAVRTWLASDAPGLAIPGGEEIARRYAQFSRTLTLVLLGTRLRRDEMTFADYPSIVESWLLSDDARLAS